MNNPKQSTSYPGVRFRIHQDRRHNKRVDKCFFIRYRNAEGKTVEESVGWASDDFNAKQASELRSQIVHNIRTGTGPQSLTEIRSKHKLDQETQTEARHEERRRNLTFADAADSYIEWAKRSKKSWKTDVSTVNLHLRPTLGDIRLVEMDKHHGLELYQVLTEKKSITGEPLSIATIRHCLTLARRIINYCLDTPLPGSRGTMFQGDNPFRRIKMPRVDNTRWRYLTQEEATMVLEAVRKPCPQAHVRSQAQAERLHLICRFSLFTGARLGEILSLKPEHVFPASGTISLLDTKYGSRTVYPDDETMDMLNKVMPQRNDYIFGSPIHGQHITSDYVSHAFSAIINETTKLNTGITDRRGRITFHSLRHTYGTWQIYGGMDIETLSRLMGHTDLRTTRRYVHLAEDFKAQMAARARMQSFQVKMP